jgi:hypothetical protein
VDGGDLPTPPVGHPSIGGDLHAEVAASYDYVRSIPQKIPSSEGCPTGGVGNNLRIESANSECLIAVGRAILVAVGFRVSTQQPKMLI